jgi:dCMP deaminase
MGKAKTILGLVGKPCSGKDTVAAYLVEHHGFEHVSTGDLVRFYVAEHGLGEPTRPLLQQVANFLRAEHGPDYLVHLAIETHSDATDLILSGLRSIAEVETTKSLGVIIAVMAPIQLRYERMKARGRVSDHITFEQFKAQEEVEDANVSENAQNVLAAISLADVEVKNNGDLEHLQKQVEKLLTTI